MRTAKKLSVAAALVAASTSVLATTPIFINPDGAGPDPTVNVGSLGWNNGMAIAVGYLTAPGTTIPVGTAINTFGQGALANFNNPLGNSIGGLGLNSTYQWTYVFELNETLVAHSGPLGADSATFHANAGGFFQLYFNPALTSNNLDGTGFNSGTLVLSGSFLPFDPVSGIGSDTFTATGGVPGTPLDQFGTNNYPGILTVGGTGGINLQAAVSFANPAFFIQPPTVISITANGFTNTPFQQTNPGSCYWNGAALSSALGPNVGGTSPCPTNTVGADNGVIGPNVVFETRATSAFNAVPEPGSLALLGMGLMGLASFARRRREGSR